MADVHLVEFSLIYLKKFAAAQVKVILITRILVYKSNLDQGGIIISNCDISLLQLLFCKDIVNLKECMAAIVLL